LLNYRRENDGLRAIAVISVLLFHSHTPSFSGGFVGVDIFAVLACMAYVNLNPIRAKIPPPPETSNHTSIQKRAEAIQQNKR
jgi:hypothetical protein